jgi:hypothetical protein
MKRSKNFLFLILPILISVISVSEAHACSCGRIDAVDVAFDQTPTIAIFRVTSVERYQSGDRRPSSAEVKSATLQVQKVYKGKLAVGQEFTFTNNGICIRKFDDKDVGDDFLLFLGEIPAKGRAWAAGFCTRSRRVKNTQADVLYLEKRKSVAGKSRLSGSAHIRTQNEKDPSDWYFKNISDLVLSIRGMGLDLSVKTDEDGIFELYDLPPGKYKIFPPKFDGYISNEIDGVQVVDFTISKGKHTETLILYDIENSISGTLLDTAGEPVGDVCDLAIMPTNIAVKPNEWQTACTDREGKFSFSNILPGDYVIVGNKDSRKSSRAPFSRFYYPNTDEVQKATKFSIAPGVAIKDLKVTAPPSTDFVTITGKVRFSDGKPWANGSVWFFTGIKNEKQRKEYFYSDSLATTDENGFFRIRILKGYRGILSGSFTAIKSAYGHCPEIAKLIDPMKLGIGWEVVVTVPYEVDTSKEIGAVELNFPFPSCDPKR